MTTLYDQITDFANIEKAYRQTQKADRKFKKDAILFSMTKELNLVALWQELRTKKYVVGDYITFKVFESKERIVNAPRIRDKVVQFAVQNVISQIYEKVYISDSFACRKDKGTHKAVDRVQHFMKLCQWKYGGGWIIKLDVAKFFYSIDRDVLKRIIRKKIRCHDTLLLLDKIIDSSPEGEKGLPLGNATSQEFANLYLNELDQYAKRFLSVKWYVRYMDDVIAILPTKEEAQRILERMKWFLSTFLHLQTNKKTKIFPLKQGVNAYGYKIWTTHRLVRNQSKRAMKRRIKAMHRKLLAGEMTSKEVNQSVSSWLGYARHSNSFNLCKGIFAKYDYIDVEGKGSDYFGNIRRSGKTRNATKRKHS